MPRTKRSERDKKRTPATKVIEPRPGRGTIFVPHLRCPLCSLTARVDLFQDGPYPTYSRVEEYGGRDYIRWGPPTPLVLDEMQLIGAKLGEAQGQFSTGALQIEEVPGVPISPPIPRPTPAPARAAIEAIKRRITGFLPRIETLRAKPDATALDRLEGEMIQVFDELLEMQELARGEERNQLEAMATRLETSAEAFDQARAALAVRDPRAWSRALDLLVTCCGP